MSIIDRNSYNLTDYINNLYREINMIIPLTPLETSVTPLSQEEIAEYTLTQPFSSFENPINTECPIRLEDFSENDMVTQIKKCRLICHRFFSLLAFIIFTVFFSFFYFSPLKLS